MSAMTNTTIAAVLFEQSKPLRPIEISIPKLKPGQVMVDISYAGLCHSQLNEWCGSKGPDPYPLGTKVQGRY